MNCMKIVMWYYCWKNLCQPYVGFVPGKIERFPNAMNNGILKGFPQPLDGLID